jgi:hypothetical protein
MTFSAYFTTRAERRRVKRSEQRKAKHAATGTEVVTGARLELIDCKGEGLAQATALADQMEERVMNSDPDEFKRWLDSRDRITDMITKARRTR